MARLNACFEENSPIPTKKLSIISDPQMSVKTSYGLAGFRIIQNFCLLVSSEERSLLKQRERLLPMGKRWTWAFTLCNTLEFCRAIKKPEVLSWIETSLFQLGVWRQILQCLTGLAVPPLRAVLAGRDQAPSFSWTLMTSSGFFLQVLWLFLNQKWLFVWLEERNGEIKLGGRNSGSHRQTLKWQDVVGDKLASRWIYEVESNDPQEMAEILPKTFE